jgi:hypothetical protein
MNMLVDQNYNLDNICKIMGQIQIIYRLSNLSKMHWKLVPPVLGQMFYLKNRANNYVYLFY